MIKKLLILILISTFFAKAGYSALPSDTAWAVNASGDNTNGACFDTGGSGTDYTDTETTPILTITDLAVTEAASTTATSAAAGFTSAMVDNCMYIASGTNFTAGYYEITAYTNASTVTIDRDPTDGDGGDGSAGNAKVGGAAADPEAITPAVDDGHTVWIKAGTYAVTLNTDNGATSSTPIHWRGFNSTRGDNPTGTDRPLIDCANTRANGIVNDQQYNAYYNIRVDDCTGDGISTLGQTTWWWNVKSSNNTGDGWDDNDAAGLAATCFKCETSGNSGTGLRHDGSAGNSGINAVGVYAHDNSSVGWLVSNAAAQFHFSIADTNAGDGASTLGSCLNSVSYGNTGAGSDGFTGINTNHEFSINCIAHDNAAYGFVGTAGLFGIFDYNGYEGNATAGLQNTTAGPNDLTADPLFTNAASGDFTLQSTSTYLAAGFPQSIDGATGDYQTNIGPDQDDNTAAGSSTDLLGVIQ